MTKTNDYFMHYEKYCEDRKVPQISPLGNSNGSESLLFYEDLKQIAMRRRAVLTEIERMSPATSSKVGAAIARGGDILLSSLGLLVCALPFLIISAAIKLDSSGPVFYRQARIGKGGKIFEILKFRTMIQGAEKLTGPIWTGANDPRLTSVGAFLRRTKLDELPQLFNILKGDMTFVGPRPERPEFVHWYIKYMPAFDRRHDVKPGITGLAQLMNGYDQSAASVYKKLRWDVQYIKRKRLRTDIWLTYNTLITVLQGKV